MNYFEIIFESALQMSKQQDYIVEANELIKAYGLDTFAQIIERSPRGIQYWFGGKPKAPGPEMQRKIHELFAKHRSGEDLTDTINPDYKDALIASQQREIVRLKKDLDLSLGELRHNILLSRAIAETNQNMLIELLAKQRSASVEDLAAEVGRENGEKYQRMKEEGNFAYVGN